MRFRLVAKSVTWHDLELALILRYFTEFGSFRGELRKSGRSCCRKKVHVRYLIS